MIAITTSNSISVNAIRRGKNLARALKQARFPIRGCFDVNRTTESLHPEIVCSWHVSLCGLSSWDVSGSKCENRNPNLETEASQSELGLLALGFFRISVFGVRICSSPGTLRSEFQSRSRSHRLLSGEENALEIMLPENELENRMSADIVRGCFNATFQGVRKPASVLKHFVTSPRGGIGRRARFRF